MESHVFCLFSFHEDAIVYFLTVSVAVSLKLEFTLNYSIFLENPNYVPSPMLAIFGWIGAVAKAYSIGNNKP